jgi:hypothetical protein
VQGVDAEGLCGAQDDQRARGRGFAFGFGAGFVSGAGSAGGRASCIARLSSSISRRSSASSSWALLARGLVGEGRRRGLELLAVVAAQQAGEQVGGAEAEAGEGVPHAAGALLEPEIDLEGPGDVAAEELGEGVVAHAQQLLEQGHGEQAGGAAALEDQLGEGDLGQVEAGLRVDDPQVLAEAHALCDLLEGDVAAAAGVVEPTIAVLLDLHAEGVADPCCGAQGRGGTGRDGGPPRLRSRRVRPSRCD